MENIEYITATAAKEAKQKESGQGSLFDMLGDANSIDNAKFSLAGSDEEFDPRQIQIFEKEFLGFYVTSHPLSDLAELPNDKIVTICGLVTGIKQIPTKNDPSKFIRFVTIEDLSGRIDAIAFNSKIAEYNDFLQPEQRIIVSGKVNRRNENDPPAILIDTVKTVDNSNIFTINVKQDLSFEEFFQIKQLLCKNSGSDPVMFKLPDLTGPVRILTSSIFWVNSSNDLVNLLKKNFGNKIELSIRSMDRDFAEDDEKELVCS